MKGRDYTVAVLDETIDRLISEKRLTALQAYAFRLFVSEARKTSDPKNYHWRTEMVGRACDAAELPQ